MKEQTVILQKDGSLSRIVGLLSALVKEMPLKVTIAEYRRTRTLEQNAYLWGCVYPTILQHLPGWDARDVHEYLLGEWSGWQVIEGFGRKRMKPLRRSSASTRPQRLAVEIRSASTLLATCSGLQRGHSD